MDYSFAVIIIFISIGSFFIQQINTMYAFNWRLLNYIHFTVEFIIYLLWLKSISNNFFSHLFHQSKATFSNFTACFIWRKCLFFAWMMIQMINPNVKLLEHFNWQHIDVITLVMNTRNACEIVQSINGQTSNYFEFMFDNWDKATRAPMPCQ